MEIGQSNAIEPDSRDLFPLSLSPAGQPSPEVLVSPLLGISCLQSFWRAVLYSRHKVPAS